MFKMSIFAAVVVVGLGLSVAARADDGDRWDRRGDRIDERLDRRGDRIDGHLDRKGSLPPEPDIRC